MPFERQVLHHGSSPAGAAQVLSARIVQSCWFELHRQGGCGAGEVVLLDDFEDRQEVELGDWISLELQSGVRCYLGRVEERRAESPARVRLRLQGMAVELNETFPGGFGLSADGRKPHRYAATDLFGFDPDYAAETFDAVSSVDELVALLLTQYGGTGGHIQFVPERVEPPVQNAPVTSLKVRGEESLRSLLKELAVRAQSAAWGVDAQGEFFFLRPRHEILATFRDGRDLVELQEVRDRELLFNRILLTGDYVYDTRENSGQIARRSYRWRGNYVEPASRGAHGDRRIRIWLPWIRTQSDSLAFAREFFRTYARPRSRYFVETGPVDTIPLPWHGRIRLEARDGQPLIQARIETVRVLFDHVVRLRMELGPDDPRDVWPEPPQDERWELPDGPPQGGIVSLPSSLTDDDDGGGGTDPFSDEDSGDSYGSSGLYSSDISGPGSSDLSEGSSDGASSDPAGTSGSDNSDFTLSFGDSDDSNGNGLSDHSDDGDSSGADSDPGEHSSGGENSSSGTGASGASSSDGGNSSGENSSEEDSSGADTSSDDGPSSEGANSDPSSDSGHSSDGGPSSANDPSSDAGSSSADGSSSGGFPSSDGGSSSSNWPPDSSSGGDSSGGSSGGSSGSESSEGITFIWE